MCAALIGGMDRLKADYERTAKESGWKLRCFAHNGRNLQERIGASDLVIIFTGKISHEAKRKAAAWAKSRNIPVRLSHSCGVGALRECLANLS